MKDSVTNEGRPIPKKLLSGSSFDFKACCLSCGYTISQREFKDHEVTSINRNFDKKKFWKSVRKEKADLLLQWKKESHLPPIYMSLMHSAMLHVINPLE